MVTKVPNLMSGVKGLMTHLFTPKEMVTSSLMGCHTNKQNEPKPSLDMEKRQIIESKCQLIYIVNEMHLNSKYSKTKMDFR